MTRWIKAENGSYVNMSLAHTVEVNSDHEVLVFFTRDHYAKVAECSTHGEASDAIDWLMSSLLDAVAVDLIDLKDFSPSGRTSLYDMQPGVI